MIDLQGKVAVVTGSGQGLGLSAAQALAQAGAAVVVNDIDAERAQAAVDSIVQPVGAQQPRWWPLAAARLPIVVLIVPCRLSAAWTLW